MRLFTAIELDAAVQRELTRWIEAERRERDGVRWCPPDQLHITLKFLGEVPPQRLGDVTRIVEDAAAALAPADIVISVIGVFPGPHAPRILWAGVTDAAGVCAAFVQRADAPLAALGIPLETRPFSPHITLARGKSPDGSRTLRRILASAAPPKSVSQRIQRVTLFESRLGPRGPQYTALQRAELAK